jgi:hypothetical protein
MESYRALPDEKLHRSHRSRYALGLVSGNAASGAAWIVCKPRRSTEALNWREEEEIQQRLHAAAIRCSGFVFKAGKTIGRESQVGQAVQGDALHIAGD